METKSHKIIESSIIDCKDRVEDLLKLHWDESSRNKHVMVLKPDWDAYLNLDKLNRLVTLLAVDNNDEIIGYSCNILSQHIHYADLSVAYNDVLFLHPDYRNSSIGLKLIKETEKKCKERGAQLFLWHAKQNTALDAILPRMGCKVQEIIYSKEL